MTVSSATIVLSGDLFVLHASNFPFVFRLGAPSDSLVALRRAMHDVISFMRSQP